MDEFTAVMKARELVRKAGIKTIPVPIELYLNLVNAKLKLDKTMGSEESGSTFEMGGKYCISINENDRPERRRFTACHEIAHIALGLPSEHGDGPWWSFAKRSPNEILCDAFAAELLLPHTLFKPLVDKADIGFDAISSLAEDFETSLTATGSRFAAFSAAPCAFVLSEGGSVRYSSMSRDMREAKAWVPFSSLPKDCQAAALRGGARYGGPEKIAADLWFENWKRGGVLCEDTRYSKERDQTLSLLWFEDEELPQPITNGSLQDDDDGGLAELDGNLPWPGKRRRK